jgi:hypothetical protein
VDAPSLQLRALFHPPRNQRIRASSYSPGTEVPVAEFRLELMIQHARREAKREKIPTDMIALTYEDPDDARPSDHDDLREVRSRWFGEQGLDIVVDTYTGQVITVWRRGVRP